MKKCKKGEGKELNGGKTVGREALATGQRLLKTSRVSLLSSSEKSMGS